MCGVSAGKNPNDGYLEDMVSEAPGPINFTMFLTMFGEKLNGTDPEDVIKNAFNCFDKENSGDYSCPADCCHASRDTIGEARTVPRHISEMMWQKQVL